MATGQRTTYTDTTTQKRSVADLITMIEWTEAPLLNLLGVNNESRFRLVNWPRTKFEWLEDTMSPRSTTLAANISSAGATTFTVASDTGQYFKNGDVLEINNELVWVESVSGDTITVASTGGRGFGGTTATTHSSGDTVELATIARLEGAVATTGHTTTVSAPYNYTQILAEAVQVTGSQEIDSNYGYNDEMARQIAKLIGGPTEIGSKGKAGKLAILLQQGFYKGRRSQGTATTARSFGGFEQFVTTNLSNVASAALTRKHIEDLFESCFLAGGMPDTLVCNSWVRRKITSFYEGAIHTDRSETRGGSSITHIVTDFGDIEIVHDRWCPQSKAYLIEKDKMGWVTYRPFSIYDRASTGDYELKDVLGEYSFALMNEESHGLLYNISTTK